MPQWMVLDVEGAPLGAYLVEPVHRARAGLVVVQEIFGVNAHIRSVCGRFAQERFMALAPQLFDPLEKNAELDYSEAGIARGRDLRTRLGWEKPLAAIAAAIAYLRRFGKVGVVGYCWGGSLAFLSSCRLEPDCTVCYYGGQIAQFASEPVRAPTLFHFGEKDSLIPLSDVETIRRAQAGQPAEFHLYPAGHGFNCDQRADYDEASASLALTRTLEFLTRHLAKG